MKALPDLRLLATFLAIVDTGSMAAAATQLGYVPSAVSQHVAALERSLGVQLLARKPGQRVALTGAGRSVERAARALHVAVAAYQDIASRIAVSELAELRIGTFPTALSHLLPGVLKQFAVEEPGIHLQLVSEETPRGLPLVKNGDIDLLVAYKYLAEDDPPSSDKDLTIQVLGHEPLVLVSRRDEAALTLDDCRDRAWVSGYVENADNRLLHRWARRFDLDPQVPFETTDTSASLALIEAGLAVGLLPAIVAMRPAVAGQIQLVSLPPGEQYPTRAILAVTRANYTPSPVGRLISRLRQELRQIISNMPTAPTNGTKVE